MGRRVASVHRAIAGALGSHHQVLRDEGAAVAVRARASGTGALSGIAFSVFIYGCFVLRDRMISFCLIS